MQWTLGLLSLGACALLAISLSFTPEDMARGGPIASLGFVPQPCPGCVLCGMSRAFCATSHLRLGDAFDFNPLVVVVYPVVALVAAGGPTLFLRERLRR